MVFPAQVALGWGVVAVLLFDHCCSPLELRTEKSYFPLQVGNEWVYRGPAGHRLTVRVSSSDSIDGIRVFVVDEISGPNDLNGLPVFRPIRQVHYAMQGDSVVRRKVLDIAGDEVTIWPPLTKMISKTPGASEDGFYSWYKLEAKQEDVWYAYGNGYLDPSFFGDYRIELITRNETIRIGESEFTECLRFRTLQRNASTPGPIDEWLAPGVGMIKREEVDHSLNYFELESYRLAK